MTAIICLIHCFQIVIVSAFFLVAPKAWGRVDVKKMHDSSKVENGDYDRDVWRSILNKKTVEQSKLQFIENTASGLAIFAVGTYGSKSTKAASFTSSVYSFLQTGGLLLVSSGIHDYMAGSMEVDMNHFFMENDQISRNQMRAMWVAQKQKDEFATVVADLFLWSSLGVVYLNSALNDHSLSTTSRSIYFFLASNSVILGGVAAYKYMNLSADKNSFSLVPATRGMALAWNSSF